MRTVLSVWETKKSCSKDEHEAGFHPTSLHDFSSKSLPSDLPESRRHFMISHERSVRNVLMISVQRKAQIAAVHCRELLWATRAAAEPRDDVTTGKLGHHFCLMQSFCSWTQTALYTHVSHVAQL